MAEQPQSADLVLAASAPVTIRVNVGFVDRICLRVDDVLSRAGGLPDAFARFATGNPHEVPGAYDPNAIFAALPHVRPLPGFVLDYVWRGDHHGGGPVLYARRADEAPAATLEALQERLGTATKGRYWSNWRSLPPHVGFDWTPVGLVELAVYLNEVDWFYWDWHAHYGRVELAATPRQRPPPQQWLRGNLPPPPPEPFGATVTGNALEAEVAMLTCQLNCGYSLTRWHLARDRGLVGTTSRTVAQSNVTTLF